MAILDGCHSLSVYRYNRHCNSNGWNTHEQNDHAYLDPKTAAIDIIAKEEIRILRELATDFK